MLQTSINNVEMMQRSATLQYIAPYFNRLTKSW